MAPAIVISDKNNNENPSRRISRVVLRLPISL